MLNAIYCLIRLDKPIGIFLLWWPTAWALWIANQGMPPLHLLGWFILGTILMRSAGCVVNDIADRQIDLHVERTRTRPLTSGQLSLGTAFVVLAVLLALSLLVLLQLSKRCFYDALIALALSMTYPFCKRILPTPQGVLALAFSMGIPMAFDASNVPFNQSMVVLMVINCLWVLAYDTIYARLDKADDERIGVHSTARYWEKQDRQVIVGLQIVMQLLWVWLAYTRGAMFTFYLLWIIASMSLGIQQYYLTTDSKPLWFRAFKLNGWYGCLMWCGLFFF